MDDIDLNRYAQGYESKATALAVFQALPTDDQRRVLQTLTMLVEQSHPGPSDIDAALDGWPIRPRCTPAEMLRANFHHKPWKQFASLPTTEYSNALAVMLGLLGVADNRRRQSADLCMKRSCHHWWHHDLSDRAEALRKRSSI